MRQLICFLICIFVSLSTCYDTSSEDPNYHICLPTAMDCSALGMPDYIVSCLDCGPPNSRGVCNEGKSLTCSTEIPVSCYGDCRRLAKGAKVIGSEGGPEDGDGGDGNGGGQDDGSYDQDKDWSNGNGNAGNGDWSNGQWDGNK